MPFVIIAAVIAIICVARYYHNKKVLRALTALEGQCELILTVSARLKFTPKTVKKGRILPFYCSTLF